MIGTTKVFNSLDELEAGINEVNRQAMKRTLERMLDKLGEFIEDDVYGAYYPYWYDRSYYLSENYKNIFEIYFWNNFGKNVGGGIRVNNTSFPSSPVDFFHGSGNVNTGTIYSQLDLDSYLEIMNNPNVINPNNPFHFPSNSVMGKGQFWDDFLNWADDNFSEIFIEEFRNLS